MASYGGQHSAAQKAAFAERMGRSHASLDEQFKASWNNCQQMEELVDRMRQHLQQWMDGIRGMIVNGHAVSDDFKTFYEREPERLTGVAIKNELLHQGFRTDKLNLLERLVNQNVFLRMQEFKVELAGVRNKVSDREVARKRYDHYNAKINELRDARARQKAKGKELSVSELDKLTRNEKKYEDARLEYVAINRLVARSLWNTWARRFVILDPIYAEIVKIQANFTQALSNQMQTILPALKAQMSVELKPEQLPAVFQTGPGPSAGKAGGGVNGSGKGGVGFDEDEDGTGDVHGVLSPGGSQQMDPRLLAQRMQRANEQLTVDAAVAQRKAAAKAQAATVAAAGGKKAAVPLGQDDEDATDSDEEDEAALRAALAAKKAAKAAAAAKAAKKPTAHAAPASSNVPMTSFLAAVPRGVPTKKAAAPVAAAGDDEEEDEASEDGVDDDSEDDEEERARKAKRARKKEKERAKERAAAAVAAKSSAGSKQAASSTTNLDFLSDIVGVDVPATKSKKAAAAAAQPDLLAFSPVKGSSPSADWMMDVSQPAATTAAAKPASKSKKLELDSFFGAQQAPAPIGGPSTGGSLSPGAAAAAQSPPDPFADLPAADVAGPVDLFAVPVQQPQQTNEFPNGSAQTPGGSAPGYSRSASLNPGGGGVSAGLDDPFFSAPLPLPTSITPAAAAMAAGAGAAAAQKAAAGKKKKKAVPSSDESSSESETSDSEQEEGRTKQAAAAAKGRAKTAAGGGAVAATASKKPAAQPTQPSARPSVNPQAAPVPSLSDPSPHGPPVPSMPRAGLPELHVASPAAAAAAPAAAAAAAAAPAGKASATPSSSANPRSPEDYSPTRDNYDPFRDGAKPSANDPFAGVNEDW